MIEKTDPSLLDEDLLEMVNAGILPATVTLSERAKLWASVLPNISPQPSLVVADAGDLAWAMRKDNPKLQQLVDEFVKTSSRGNVLRNTLVRRYLENNQCDQESDHRRPAQEIRGDRRFLQAIFIAVRLRLPDGRGPGISGVDAGTIGEGSRGAVGIMQVKPSTAAAPPISVPDIWNGENNIQAGVKVLQPLPTRISAIRRSIRKTGCSSPSLLTMPVPTALRSCAREQRRGDWIPISGLRNVELLVAQDVGPVTVQYVSNIYKYYVAYKLVVEQGQSLQRARYPADPVSCTAIR